MNSLWEQTSTHRDFPRLEQDVKTRVLIIGGGMAGVLCAHLLHQAGIPYVLAEAGRVCGGVTKNTTAKITVPARANLPQAGRAVWRGAAGQYLRAQETALEQYRELCQDIDCGFEEKDAYVYSRKDREKIDRELRALDKLGYPGGICRAASPALFRSRCGEVPQTGPVPPLEIYLRPVQTPEYL